MFSSTLASSAPDRVQPSIHSYRRRTLALYLTIGLLMLVSAAYAIAQVWQSYMAQQLTDMRRDVIRTSQQVDATIADATRVLDMAKRDLNTALRQGAVSQLQAHDILRRTTDRLSMPGSVVSQGLLFAVDNHGVLYARNSVYPVPPLHVADRLYFKQLRADPQLRFSVGNLTVGRADQRVVFHIAEPLLNASSGFAGVVLQQIPGEELQHALEVSAGAPAGPVMVLINASAVAFTYPMPAKPDAIDPALIARLYAAVMRDGKSGGWVQGSGSAISDHDMLVYTRSSSTGLIVIERVTQRQLVLAFLVGHLGFFGATALAGALIALLLALHYRQTVNLLDARNASMLDELTGLPNRRALDDRFPLLWREALRLRANTSALFIDIDHFKQFNDTHGHVCADQVLRLVAQSIQDNLRRPFDFVCRWGGEEFVALLPQTDAHGAMQIADIILHKVRGLQIDFEGCRAAKVSVSIGVCSLKVTPEHFENDLISLADKAMLQAKQNGRDQIYLA